MVNLKRKRLFNTPKNTVLVSIILLALSSWCVFWIYTRLSIDIAVKELSAERQEQIIARLQNAQFNLDFRTGQLEMLIVELANQAQTPSRTGLATQLRPYFIHAINTSPDLASVTFRPDWPPKTALLEEHADKQPTASTPPAWISALPYSFEETVTSETLWWSPLYFNSNGELLISLVKPLLDKKNKIIGSISLEWKAAAALKLVKPTEATAGTISWLVDRTGKTVEHAYNGQHLNYASELVTQAQKQMPLPTFVTERNHISLNDISTPAELFYTPTQSGMMLVMAVPHVELNNRSVIMEEQNTKHLMYVGVILLLLTLAGLLALIPALRNLRAFYNDKLTGLPNRARLLQELEGDSAITLVLLNLDRFREVNSLFGDACGDLILKEVALRLESYMSNTENRGGHLYRVGGDEFALVLPRKRPELVQEQLEKILGSLRQAPVYWQGHEIGLSATVGAAVPWFDTPKEHSLYIHAGEALREARKKGLHCRVYDGSEPLEQQFEHNQKWAGRLREALDTEGLIAWFQPILNNTTGRVDKYECLVRMLDKNGDVIGPGKFLGVAGKLRLDRHITRVMVEQCFTRFSDSPLQFSINLSYADLQHAELTRFILDRLDQTGVGPRVIFELLETASIENYDQVRDFVDAVKQRGCRIAIDDFGTGYSNFEHLLQLKVDIIKIDGSLIRNLDKDPNSRRVARGIVGLARSMKIETVAEYVHSPAIQMEVLRLGISFSQGELIGMPAPELLVHVPKELTKLSYSGRSVVKTAMKV